MASVSFQNVTKVFERRVTALSDLTLEVPDGQFTVLVGPSGCGKTTALRLVAGLEDPTRGEIRIASRTAEGVPPQQRDVAMVFQDGALYPHMDVYANLAFGLRMQKGDEGKIRHQVTAAARMLGVADLLDRKPTALSGGQRRRVALGRAVVREPGVFLFDEPLSNLDAQLQLTLRSELKALHERLGATVLHVTHDQAEAMALGQTICVLREGRLQQVGSPEAIYDRPANRFVAGFFGVPPMNFLVARVRSMNGSLALAVGDQLIEAPRHLAKAATRDAGQSIVVGLRPHDLSLESGANQTSNCLSGRLMRLERLGSHTDLCVKLPSGDVCTVIAAPRFEGAVDDEIRLRIDPERIHLFECDQAGRRIDGPGSTCTS